MENQPNKLVVVAVDVTRIELIEIGNLTMTAFANSAGCALSCIPSTKRTLLRHCSIGAVIIIACEVFRHMDNNSKHP